MQSCVQSNPFKKTIPGQNLNCKQVIVNKDIVCLLVRKLNFVERIVGLLQKRKKATRMTNSV